MTTLARSSTAAPKPTRPVGIRQHEDIIDLFIAPDADVTRGKLTIQAAKYGQVEWVGRHIQLTVDPFYDPDAVAGWFEREYPGYEVTEGTES